MPLADKRHIVATPFAVVPGRCRWDAFLAQRIYSHDPVAAPVFADLDVGVGRLVGRVGRRAIALLAWSFDLRALHAVDAIALDLFLGVSGPFQLAIVAVFLGEEQLG